MKCRTLLEELKRIFMSKGSVYPILKVAKSKLITITYETCIDVPPESSCSITFSETYNISLALAFRSILFRSMCRALYKDSSELCGLFKIMDRVMRGISFNMPNTPKNTPEYPDRTPRTPLGSLGSPLSTAGNLSDRAFLQYYYP